MKATRQHYWGKTIESENDIGNPSLLISCSNDGKLFVYDLKDPWTNCTLVRLRGKILKKKKKKKKKKKNLFLFI